MNTHLLQYYRELSDFFICQCQFAIPKGYCKNLLYRYTIDGSPEMLSANNSGHYEEVQRCYRQLYLSSDCGMIFFLLRPVYSAICITIFIQYVNYITVKPPIVDTQR